MRLLVTFVLFWVCCSCRKDEAQAPVTLAPPGPPAATDTGKRYLALGDSYTIGQSVNVSERFPAQVVALLKAQAVKIVDPVYIAQTGWTTANLQSAINTLNPPTTYDVVTLLIGVNDQYQRMDTAGYRIRFTALLEKGIQLAKGKKTNVFVLSIPDYSVTPFVHASDKSRVSTEVDLFNMVNRRITLAYGVSYTDITPSSRQGSSNPALIASDGLHPSSIEYAKWAEVLAPKIKAALQ